MPKKQVTQELKREIGDLVSTLKTQNFYTILRVSVDAPRDQIRKAYFALSKEFHPDSFYGEELGDLKSQLEIMFRSITKAYDVLSSDKKREKYNQYLRQKNDLKGIESSATSDLKEVKDKVRERTGVSPVMARFGASEARPGPVPARSATPARPSQAPRFDSSMLDRSASRHAQWKRRRLKSLLNIQQARVEQAKVSEETAKKIQDLLSSAEAAEKEKNYLGAINALKVAITLDPDNGDLQDRFNNIISQFAPVLGQRYYSVGLNEEEFGDMASAAESFQKAVDYVPDNAEYVYKLAHAVMESGGDLHQAYNHAKKAIGLSPREALYHLLLGKICLKAGLQKSAVASLKNCLSFDPKNAEAKELLRNM
jgi:curved DNA-binding protein CbpA